MAYEVVSSEKPFEGHIVTVRVDRVRMPDGSVAPREVVEHVDAVAVVALNDEAELVLIRQYRHPFGKYLWELPAGLQDKSGEAPLATARRELAEETGWQAERWDTLVDLRPSPGMSTESVRVYLAAGLSQQPREGEADGEEADLESRWISLPAAVREVLDGKVTNALALAGILAADAASRVAAGGLRAVDAPWPGSSSSE